MGVYIQDVDIPKQDEILQIRIYGDGKVSRVYDIECQQIGTAIETTSELVRCKDCDRGFGSPVCPIQSQGWAINTDTFFCAWGERREL